MDHLLDGYEDNLCINVKRWSWISGVTDVIHAPVHVGGTGV